MSHEIVFIKQGISYYDVYLRHGSEEKIGEVWMEDTGEWIGHNHMGRHAGSYATRREAGASVLWDWKHVG